MFPGEARHAPRGGRAVALLAAMYAFEEHVGEVRLRVDAPTLAGLFEEAARALCELVTAILASLVTRSPFA